MNGKKAKQFRKLTKEAMIVVSKENEKDVVPWCAYYEKKNSNALGGPALSSVALMPGCGKMVYRKMKEDFKKLRRGELRV